MSLVCHFTAVNINVLQLKLLWHRFLSLLTFEVLGDMPKCAVRLTLHSVKSVTKISQARNDVTTVQVSGVKSDVTTQNVLLFIQALFRKRKSAIAGY